MAKQEKDAAFAATPPAADPPVTEQDIAALAYSIYLSRGGAHGNDVEDWLEAERMLKYPDAAY